MTKYHARWVYIPIRVTFGVPVLPVNASDVTEMLPHV
jgi:hypothetical protein